MELTIGKSLFCMVCFLGYGCPVFLFLYWRAKRFANLSCRSYAAFICRKRIFAYRMKPIEKLYLLSNEF